MHSILVDVLQSCQVRTLIGQLRVAVLKPNLTTLGVVITIAFAGRKRVKMSEEGRELLLGLEHEMVMIRE